MLQNAWGFDQSVGSNSVLFPFLRIWIVIPTFSASSKVTFLIEKQYVAIIKVVFCITSRENHFEACTSDFYNNKRIKKSFCNSREGVNSVLLPFLCTWIVIPTLSASSEVAFFIEKQYARCQVSGARGQVNNMSNDSLKKYRCVFSTFFFQLNSQIDGGTNRPTFL